MNTFDSPLTQFIHYATGLVVGAIVVVIITLIGLPDIFLLWGVAAAFMIWLRFEPEDPDEKLRADGGHLPSDPSAANQQAAWRNYEERHVTVRFERLWCNDCNTHREHRIEHDHLRGFGETECRSCHTVDLVDSEGGSR